MNPLLEVLRAYRRFWPMYRPLGFVMGLLAVPLLALVLAGGLGEGRAAGVLLGVICGFIAAFPTMHCGPIRESSLAWTLPFRKDLRRATWGTALLLGLLVLVRAWTWSGVVGALLAITWMILTVGVISLCVEGVLLFLIFGLWWQDLAELVASPFLLIPAGLAVGWGFVAFGLGNRHLRFRAQNRAPHWMSSTRALATTEDPEAEERSLLSSLGSRSSYRLPDRRFLSWLRASIFEGARLRPALGLWLIPLATLVAGGLWVWWISERGGAWVDVVVALTVPVVLIAVALASAGSITPPVHRGGWHPVSRLRMARLRLAGGGLALATTLIVGAGGLLLLFGLLPLGAVGGPDRRWLGAVLRGSALLVLFFPWIHWIVRKIRSHSAHDRHPVLPVLETLSLVLVVLTVHALWLRSSGAYPTPVEWGVWLLATVVAYTTYGWRIRTHYLRGDLA